MTEDANTPMKTFNIEATDDPHVNAENIAKAFVEAAVLTAEAGNENDEGGAVCMACLFENLMGLVLREISQRDDAGKLTDLKETVGGLISIQEASLHLIAHLAHEHGKREGLTTTKH